MRKSQSRSKVPKKEEIESISEPSDQIELSFPTPKSQKQMEKFEDHLISADSKIPSSPIPKITPSIEAIVKSYNSLRLLPPFPTIISKMDSHKLNNSPSIHYCHPVEDPGLIDSIELINANLKRLQSKSDSCFDITSEIKDKNSGNSGKNDLLPKSTNLATKNKRRNLKITIPPGPSLPGTDTVIPIHPENDPSLLKILWRPPITDSSHLSHFRFDNSKISGKMPMLPHLAECISEGIRKRINHFQN